MQSFKSRVQCRSAPKYLASKTSPKLIMCPSIMFGRSIGGTVAIAISPVASGTGLNKQRAIWCNRWVLKVAERIYVGTIKRGGTLDTLLSSYRG